MGMATRTDVFAGVVEVFDDAVTNCDELVRIASKLGDWKSARIGVGEGEYDPNLRDNAVAFFHPFDFRCPIPMYKLGRTVWQYINDYAIRYSVSFSNMEGININRYYPGERYKPHADDGPGNRRIISALLYMNDVEVGGETEFPYFDIKIRPKKGRLIIFPSNYAYTHAALPPESGVKYSAAFWTNP